MRSTRLLVTFTIGRTLGSKPWVESALSMRRAVTSAALLLCANALSAGALFAQDQTTDPRHPTVIPTRVAVPPHVDGKLDDPIWQTAARVTDFVQERPIGRRW